MTAWSTILDGYSVISQVFLSLNDFTTELIDFRITDKILLTMFQFGSVFLEMAFIVGILLVPLIMVVWLFWILFLDKFIKSFISW